MDALLAELDRERQWDDLLSFLLQSTNCLAVIRGPSGCGKSWYARALGAVWEEAGGVAITADGDQTKTHRELFPITYSLAALPKSWHALARKRGRKLATSVGSVLATLATGLSVPQSVGEGLLDLITGDPKEQLPFLTDAELKALQILKKLAARKPCLMILDDYQWWDRASRDFISLLHSEQLRAKVTALADLRTIVILRDDDLSEQLVAEAKAICPNRYFEQRLRPCTLQQFPRVLHAIGLRKELGEAVTKEVYDLTGGHLKVAERLAAHLNSSGGLSPALATIGQRDFLVSIIGERLSLLMDDAGEVLKVLKYASVVGSSFTKRELMCLAQVGSDQIDAMIDAAVGERLLSRSQDRVMFSHDVIRSAVLQVRSEPATVEINRKYAGCLRALSPGEYALRSDVHHELDDAAEAATFAAMAILKFDRGHMRSAREVPPSLLERVEAQRLQGLLSTIRHAHHCFQTARFAAGIQTIEAMPLPEDTLLLAEAEYVRCLNLMEMETLDAFEEAVSRLSSFEDLVDEEFELGLRLQLLKQQVLVLAGQISEARAVEAKAFRALSPRLAFDLDSAVTLHVNNRKADAIYQSEVALQKIHRSIKFFRGGEDPNAPLYPTEFYKSLTNLAAVQIKLGALSRAKEAADLASRLIRQNPEISFPRRDLLVNNSTLAQVRMDHKYGAAAAIMDAISSSSEARGESFLYRCNHAGLALLDGNAATSRAILDELQEELTRRGISEAYLVYYCRCHEITWQLIYGDKARARLLFREFGSFLSSLHWPSKPYLLKRYEALRPHVLGKARVAVEFWDTGHLFPEQIGPAWSHYGRGVPLCELQFWSEV